MSEAWSDVSHRSGKWRHSYGFRKGLCTSEWRLLLWKNTMDTNLLLSDSPADLPTILLFFGTILFLAWLDYGNDKYKK